MPEAPTSRSETCLSALCEGESTLLDVLLTCVEEAVRSARVHGADQAEAYADSRHFFQFTLAHNAIREVRNIYDAGLSVRAFKSGGLGYFHTMNLQRPAAREAGSLAAQLACNADPDANFKSLPNPNSFPSNPEREPDLELLDERLQSLQIADFQYMLNQIINDVVAQHPGCILSGRILIQRLGLSAIANSLGVTASQRFSSIFVDWTAEALSQAPTAPGYAFHLARHLDEEAIRQSAYQAAEMSRRLADSQPLPSGRYTLLLSPRAVWDLGLIFRLLLSGQRCNRGASCLAYKEGKRIASKKLDVTSDATVPKGIMSFKYDAEGVPSQSIKIIEDGVLRAYFHTSYSAGEQGKVSNGCARRQSYRSPVFSGIGNLQYRPGSERLSDMMAQIRSGVYLTSMPKPDPLTGKINAPLERAFWISDGEIGAAVKRAVIVENFPDMLMRIDAVSKDFEYMSGFVLPHILIPDVRIVDY